MSKFNIGVFVDDVKVSKQVYDLLEMANKSTIILMDHLKVTTLLVTRENSIVGVLRK